MRSISTLAALSLAAGASTIAAPLVATLAPLALAAPALSHGGNFPPPPQFPPAGGGTPGGYRGPTGDTGGRPVGGPGGGPAGPATPSGPIPVGPLPGGRALPPWTPGGPSAPPGPAAGVYTLAGEEVRDRNDWQLWWEFNRDLYLRRDERRARRSTGSDDFYLGLGQREVPPPERITPAVLFARVIPTLQTVLSAGGDVRLTQQTIVSLARACRPEDPIGLPTSMRWFLAENELLEMKQLAALGLGVQGRAVSVEPLLHLLLDDAEGHSLVSGPEVAESVRAFAAYALALLGSESDLPETRRRIVRAMAQTLDDAEASPDLRATAALALGFVPLPLAKGEPQAETPPETSLETQLDYVMGHFADGRAPLMVRAQLACSMGRLLSHRPAGADPALKQQVVDLLVRCIESDRRQAEPIRECALLGLGMIGDADADPADEWVRYALRRAFYTGGPLEKRFALIGMGLVASRPGQGEEPYAATELMRGILMHHMTKGQRNVRPWAALGLGVMGYWHHANGTPTDPAVGAALRLAVRNARSGADDLGAYALAVGLRRDPAAVEDLLDKLERVRDAVARSQVATALGMIGDRAAIDPLQELVGAKRTPPALRREAGAALGMLGDPSAVELLLERLDASEGDTPTQAGLARALGGIGDERCLDSLAKLFGDAEVDPEVRLQVAIALGDLADRQPVKWRALLATGTNYAAGPTTLTSSARTGVLDFY